MQETRKYTGNTEVNRNVNNLRKKWMEIHMKWVELTFVRQTKSFGKSTVDIYNGFPINGYIFTSYRDIFIFM